VRRGSVEREVHLPEQRRVARISAEVAVDGQNSIAAVEPTKMLDSAGPIMAAIEVRLTLFPSS
jgi:hypothetical protein